MAFVDSSRGTTMTIGFANRGALRHRSFRRITPSCLAVVHDEMSVSAVRAFVIRNRASRQASAARGSIAEPHWIRFNSRLSWFRKPTLRRRAAWLALLLMMLAGWRSVGSAQDSSITPKTQSSSALVEDARKLIQSGHPQDALSLLQQADLRGSEASEIHTLKGICFAVLAKPIESTEEFDQAIALRPNSAPVYLSSGLAAASLNNLDRAIGQLSTALQLDPNLPGARYSYALVLARASKYADSEKQLDIELASKRPKAESAVNLWKLKGRDAFYQKKWQNAIEAYNKVLQFEPDYAEAYSATGESLFALNRTSESLVALRKAVALDPEDAPAHATLGKVYQEDGDLDKAIPEFEAAMRLRPADREATFRLFRIYISKGDKTDAARLERHLQDLAASNITDSLNESKATALNNTGIELEKQGDYASALNHYEEAAQADATNIIFERNAALLLCKMERPQEAIRRLQDILALEPDDAETQRILNVAKELAAGQSGLKKKLPAPQSSQ